MLEIPALSPMHRGPVLVSETFSCLEACYVDISAAVFMVLFFRRCGYHTPGNLHFFGVTGFHTMKKMRYFNGKSIAVSLANIVHG